ncbi:Lactation elevated protein 1 [Podochytrium sp. JEL0797]|nr:Lactation elevated protein 1 [Podochytrium sp. JEL0797]
MVLRRLFTSLFALNQNNHARQPQPSFSLVATSNKRISELYQTGLNGELVKPLLKLLDSNCETIDMPSKDGDAMDYRRSGSQRDESRVFYYPPSNEMRAAFLQSFEKACKGVLAYNLTVSLPHGRSIPAFGSFDQRVLLIPFETLCGAEGKPCGADYVALCRFFGHIFIQGPVPLLDADSVNFKGTRSIDLGRRFINFIDVAYDSRVHFCVETEAGVEDMLQGLRSKEDGRLFAAGVMETQVKKEGGSSSSGATTYVGMMEWLATRLIRWPRLEGLGLLRRDSLGSVSALSPRKRGMAGRKKGRKESIARLLLVYAQYRAKKAAAKAAGLQKNGLVMDKKQKNGWKNPAPQLTKRASIPPDRTPLSIIKRPSGNWNIIYARRMRKLRLEAQAELEANPPLDESELVHRKFKAQRAFKSHLLHHAIETAKDAFNLPEACLIEDLPVDKPFGCKICEAKFESKTGLATEPWQNPFEA